MAEFKTYEEALEAAADLKVEIADVFKPQFASQNKIFQGLWKPWKGKDLAFVRDMLLYQAGYPEEDSRAKIEKFREQLSALVAIYGTLGLLDNLNLYLAECGVRVEQTMQPVFVEKTFEVPEKVQKAWDQQFFGEAIPADGPDILQKVVDISKITKFDVNAIDRRIDEIADEVEEVFAVKKSAFKQAVQLMFAEKTGKSIDEKLESIEENRKAVDKALAPFTGENDEE